MNREDLKPFNCLSNADISAGLDSHFVYDKDDVDEFIDGLEKHIAELQAENERLVKCCKEYDSRQRIDERIKFNGAKQLRATKRALWLARAERALTEAEWNRTIENGWKMFRGNYEIAKEYSNSATKWDKVEQLCRKKAEEYK